MLIDIAHYSVFSFAKSQQLGECLLCTVYWHEEWGGTCRQKVKMFCTSPDKKAELLVPQGQACEYSWPLRVPCHK